MKTLNKTIYSALLVIFLVSATSCAKMHNTNGGGSDSPEVGKFDFATTAQTNISINYGTTYPILFEIYDTNPLDQTEGSAVKNTSLKPLYRAITDDKGAYSGSMTIPTYCKDLFLYTEYFGIPALVPVKVTASGVAFDFTASETTAKSMMSTRAAGVVKGDLKVIDGWNQLGTPDNLLSRLRLDGTLISNIMYSLPENVKGIGATGDPNNLINPTEAIGNIKILKNTKINLVFLHEGASMANTLTYHCYPTATPPQSVDEITNIIAFPNFSYAYSGGELSSGDRVQLKYWDGTKFVEEFPAGTTIGWAMLTNSSFSSTTSIVDGTKPKYYSEPAFNPEKVDKQHCVALYDKGKKIIALGFEDQHREITRANGSKIGDSDFNDMTFVIETDVDGGIDIDGIPEIVPDPAPGPKPEDNFVEYTGSLLFEDLWPSEGDYDMNDVVINYHSTHYRNAEGRILRIVDKFYPRWSGASQRNGFGYQLGVTSASISSLTVKSDYADGLSLFKTDGKGLELNQGSIPTIMLFEDMKSIVAQNKVFPNTTQAITVTIEFATPQPERLLIPPYNAFIVCKSGEQTQPSRDVEVHLPNKLPTNLANKALLGTNADRSNPDKGIYYISKNNYMFALHLPADFDLPTEGQRLEKAYPRYINWVNTQGKEDSDWYRDTKVSK